MRSNQFVWIPVNAFEATQCVSLHVYMAPQF